MEITRSTSAITVTGESSSLGYVVKKDLKSEVCYLFFVYPSEYGTPSAEWLACELKIENGYDIEKIAYATLASEFPCAIGLRELAKAVLLACSTN